MPNPSSFAGPYGRPDANSARRGVLTPTGGINPRDALSTSIHANPGVYAVLIGSGVSSAAGVMTGFQIAEDLVRRVATSRGVDLESVGLTPAEWWTEETGEELSYDSLLGQLGQTRAARQGLLRTYFEPSPDGTAPREPTAAHRALSNLVLGGFFRVIITTNFDRLIERALQDVGIAPQVIASSNAVNSMTPLIHSPATVVKIHGDYLATDLRNSYAELSSYPPPLNRLLDRIFDDFGLLVIGWSAKYDVALANRIGQIRNRRYPLYWGTRSLPLPTEAEQIANRQGSYVVALDSANEFFEDVKARVDRLQAVAARHREFTILRQGVQYPEQSAVLPGWVAIPLLVVHTHVTYEGVLAEETGIIGPEFRHDLVATLRASPVADLLRALRVHLIPAEASTGNRSDPEPLKHQDWVPVPGYQSIDRAFYNWGSEAMAGVDALVRISLPSVNPSYGPTTSLDIGLSSTQAVSMELVGRALRMGVALCAVELEPVVSNLLPESVEIDRVSCSFSASQFSVSPSAVGQRDNDLRSRVDWSWFGSTPDNFGPICGFAARPGNLLGPGAISELVTEGMNHMLLSHGFIDPREGLRRLRDVLGLDPKTGKVPL